MLRTARRLIPCFVLLAGAGAAGAAESPGPIEVVETAYVDGVHRNADAAAMRAGFHPELVMFVRVDGGVRQVTLDEWAGRLGRGRSTVGSRARPKRPDPGGRA